MTLTSFQRAAVTLEPSRDQIQSLKDGKGEESARWMSVSMDTGDRFVRSCGFRFGGLHFQKKKSLGRVLCPESELSQQTSPLRAQTESTDSGQETRTLMEHRCGALPQPFIYLLRMQYVSICQSLNNVFSV